MCLSITGPHCRILQHFNTNRNEFTVVFTSGATAALKLLAENFDFGPSAAGAQVDATTAAYSDAPRGACFAYTQDNHTSVVGMRQVIAHMNHGRVKVCCVSREKVCALARAHTRPTVARTMHTQCM